MDRGDQTLQGRLRTFLRARYPHDAACLLARDIGCDARTAKNILNGHWPHPRHLQNIVRRFGCDVRDALFAPDIDATVARLSGEVRDLEEQIERKRALLRQAEGPRLGDQGFVAPRAPERAAVGPNLRQPTRRN